MSASPPPPQWLLPALVAALALVGYRAQQFRPRVKAPVRIRRARDDDAVPFQRMWTGYCVHFGADASLHAQVFARMKAEDGLLMAEINGIAVGFATFIEIAHTFSRAMYLEDLFVDEASRDLGVGRQLIAAVERRARDQGAKRLYWNALQDADSRYLYAKVARLTPLVRYQIELP